MRKIVLAILAGLCLASSANAQTIRAGGVNVQDEGGTAAKAGTFNFTGAGVSASTSAGVTTITIGAGSPYTAIANMTDNVNPGVCGTIYAVTVTAKTLTLPPAPATQVACHVGIYVAISGYATIAAGAGDTYAGNEKITQGMDVTGILDLWYVQGATTWYSQAGPPLQIWNASGSYAAGQFVVDASAPAKFCMSRVADNTNNALTDTTKWLCIGDGTIGRFNISSYFKAEDDDGNCSGTGGSALNLDLTTNSHKFFTITANCEITVTDPTSTAGEVQSVSMCWEQGGAGGFTIAYPANIKWAGGTDPTWGTTAGDDNCMFCLYRQSDDEYVCSGVEDYAQ